MQARSERKRTAQTQAILFGQAAHDVLGHISGHYPFPARLSTQNIGKLKALRVARRYPRGSRLFREAEKSTGIHVVLAGSVKLTVNSVQGKTLLLGFFGPGSVLGLAAAILGRAHATTAEVFQTAEIIQIPRKELRRVIQGNPTAARQAAELVSEACFFLMSKLAAIELSKSASQRLARCLIGLFAYNASHHEDAPRTLRVSQETISQMVGLSRETVARILSRFRQRGIVNWKRSGFAVQNRIALEKIADFPDSSGTSTN